MVLEHLHHRRLDMLLDDLHIKSYCASHLRDGPMENLLIIDFWAVAGLVSDGVNAAGDWHSMGVNLPLRRQWPDVVGMSVEEAEKKIKEDMPMATFQVVLPERFVTCDYNERRVRLYVDSSSKVVRTPGVG